MKPDQKAEAFEEQKAVLQTSARGQPSDLSSRGKKLTERELQAIEVALISSNENTIIGEFFSQAATLFCILLILLGFICYQIAQVFATKLDDSEHIKGIFHAQDFKADIRNYFTAEQMGEIELSVPKHDIFRCENEPKALGYQNQSYEFQYQYNAQTDKNYAAFSVPGKSSPAYFNISVDFDTTREQLLTDKLCIEKDFSGKKEEQELAQSHQLVCSTLLELTHETPADYLQLIQCQSDSACGFRIFMTFERAVEKTDVAFLITIGLEELEIGPECWYCPQGVFSNYTATPWLVIKPLYTESSSFDSREIVLSYQSVLYQRCLIGCIYLIGILTYMVTAVVFAKKKKQYEQRIKDKALEEIKSKQRAHNHLNTVKNIISKK